MTLLHIGDHTLLRAGETAAHLMQPIHMGFVLVGIVAVCLALRVGLRKRVRVPVRSQHKDARHDPR